MASTRPKVFLDASVLIAATLSSSGSARDLITQGIRGACELIISDDVIEECERNVGAKAPRALPQLSAFLTLLVNRVDPTRDHVERIATVIEAKDAPIVAAASAAGATFLATYDRRHLLAKRDDIAEQFQIVVTTPDDVLRRVGLSV